LEQIVPSRPDLRADAFSQFLGICGIFQFFIGWHGLCNTVETVAKTKPDPEDTVQSTVMALRN